MASPPLGLVIRCESYLLNPRFGLTQSTRCTAWERSTRGHKGLGLTRYPLGEACLCNALRVIHYILRQMGSGYLFLELVVSGTGVMSALEPDPRGLLGLRERGLRPIYLHPFSLPTPTPGSLSCQPPLPPNLTEALCAGLWGGVGSIPAVLA